MSLGSREIYEFEDFRLDIAEKVLLRAGKPLSITPKVFETLQFFLENAGQLIEKDELMERIWPGRFVEESNLTFNVKMLRKALGDDAAHPQFIETVTRRGYRFIAAVRRIEADAEDSHHVESKSTGSTHPPPPIATMSLSSSHPQRGTVVALADWRPEVGSGTGDSILRTAEPMPAGAVDPVKKRPRSWLLITFAFFVGVIGIAYYFLYFGNSTISPMGKTTIAVLPLQPIDSGTRDPIFELGIAEALINRFNLMDGMFARPLSSIRHYADAPLDPQTAGNEQKVDYVLSSTYQLSDKKIRVTWQLINIANGQVVDTQTTRTYTGDVFSMHDAIASEVGKNLAERFSTTLPTTVVIGGTHSDEAYRLYLQGMYLYDRRTFPDAQNAVEKLTQAIQLDPGYAKAWAGKAHAHRSIGNFGGRRSPHEEYQKSMSSLRKALDIEPNLSDAHSVLCENKFFYEYDFAGAEAACRRAIELEPKSYLAHEIYSRCLWTMGRFEEAIVEAKIAIDLQPTALFTLRNYAITLFYARRLPEALHEFRRVSEMDQSFVANYAWFVPALLVNGDEAEAFEWFIKWQQLLKADEGAIQSYLRAYETSGWRGVGRERIKRFDEDKIRSYFLEACLIAHTGNKKKVFEYLERSYERREWGIPFLSIDPSLDKVRDDPRFDDLVNRVQAKPSVLP